MALGLSAYGLSDKAFSEMVENVNQRQLDQEEDERPDKRSRIDFSHQMKVEKTRYREPKPQIKDFNDAQSPPESPETPPKNMERIQNDLLEEICSDIGIKDSMDLDFYNVATDSVDPQNFADPLMYIEPTFGFSKQNQELNTPVKFEAKHELHTPVKSFPTTPKDKLKVPNLKQNRQEMFKEGQFNFKAPEGNSSGGERGGFGNNLTNTATMRDDMKLLHDDEQFFFKNGMKRPHSPRKTAFVRRDVIGGNNIHSPNFHQDGLCVSKVDGSSSVDLGYQSAVSNMETPSISSKLNQNIPESRKENSPYRNPYVTYDSRDVPVTEPSIKKILSQPESRKENSPYRNPYVTYDSRDVPVTEPSIKRILSQNYNMPKVISPVESPRRPDLFQVVTQNSPLGRIKSIDVTRDPLPSDTESGSSRPASQDSADCVLISSDSAGPASPTVSYRGQLLGGNAYHGLSSSIRDNPDQRIHGTKSNKENHPNNNQEEFRFPPYAQSVDPGLMRKFGVPQIQRYPMPPQSQDSANRQSHRPSAPGYPSNDANALPGSQDRGKFIMNPQGQQMMKLLSKQGQGHVTLNAQSQQRHLSNSDDQIIIDRPRSQPSEGQIVTNYQRQDITRPSNSANQINIDRPRSEPREGQTVPNYQRQDITRPSSQPVFSYQSPTRPALATQCQGIAQSNTPKGFLIRNTQERYHPSSYSCPDSPTATELQDAEPKGSSLDPGAPPSDSSQNTVSFDLRTYNSSGPSSPSVVRLQDQGQSQGSPKSSFMPVQGQGSPRSSLMPVQGQGQSQGSPRSPFITVQDQGQHQESQNSPFTQVQSQGQSQGQSQESPKSPFIPVQSQGLSQGSPRRSFLPVQGQGQIPGSPRRPFIPGQGQVQGQSRGSTSSPFMPIHVAPEENESHGAESNNLVSSSRSDIPATASSKGREQINPGDDLRATSLPGVASNADCFTRTVNQSRPCSPFQMPTSSQDPSKSRPGSPQSRVQRPIDFSAYMKTEEPFSDQSQASTSLGSDSYGPRTPLGTDVNGPKTSLGVDINRSRALGGFGSRGASGAPVEFHQQTQSMENEQNGAIVQTGRESNVLKSQFGMEPNVPKIQIGVNPNVPRMTFEVDPNGRKKLIEARNPIGINAPYPTSGFQMQDQIDGQFPRQIPSNFAMYPDMPMNTNNQRFTLGNKSFTGGGGGMDMQPPFKDLRDRPCEYNSMSFNSPYQRSSNGFHYEGMQPTPQPQPQSTYANAYGRQPRVPNCDNSFRFPPNIPQQFSPPDINPHDKRVSFQQEGFPQDPYCRQSYNPYEKFQVRPQTYQPNVCVDSKQGFKPVLHGHPGYEGAKTEPYQARCIYPGGQEQMRPFIDQNHNTVYPNKSQSLQTSTPVRQSVPNPYIERFKREPYQNSCQSSPNFNMASRGFNPNGQQGFCAAPQEVLPSPVRADPQAGFMQELISDKSKAFRSHPLFPLLRDLIVADMNFNSPSFPYRLIANLPQSFDKLLQNFLQRNGSQTTYDANEAVNGVIMDALKYAHQSLMSKIGEKKKEMEAAEGSRPASVIEDFCERFDKAVRNSFSSLPQDEAKDGSARLMSSYPEYPSGNHHPEDSRSLRSGSSKDSQGRKHPILPKEAVAVMLEWLKHNRHNPYPNDEEKDRLMAATALTMSQINYWFTNARRRILPKWAAIEMTQSQMTQAR